MRTEVHAAGDYMKLSPYLLRLVESRESGLNCILMGCMTPRQWGKLTLLPAGPPRVS